MPEEKERKRTDYHSEEVSLDGTKFEVARFGDRVEYIVEDETLREYVEVDRETFLAMMAVARERELQWDRERARNPEDE